MYNYEYNKELDATGLECPMPVLRANKILRNMNTDSILKLIVSTDKAIKEIEEYCNKSGNKILEIIRLPNKHTLLIKKK